jgi:glycosyltransferase involved in cell wall biosynthesis
MSNQNYPTVTIGCPVRSREKHLPNYLNCILNLDYPLHLVSLLFLENNSTDNSYQILEKFFHEHQHKFNSVNIYQVNIRDFDDDRMADTREKLVYLALAMLRNLWIKNIKTEYAFSVDCDIMFQPDTLKRLLSHNLDFVSALICNGHFVHEHLTNFNPYLNLNAHRYNEQGNLKSVSVDSKGLVEVDYTGAIALMSKKVCEIGNFEYSTFGEDLPFCKSVQDAGIKLYCDASNRATHCMNERLLNEYLQGKFEF